MDFVGNLDYSLKEYLLSHLYLLDNLSKHLDLVKCNWDNYINRINERRVAIVYQVLEKFMEEERGRFLFEPFSTLDKIIRRYHLEDIFELEDSLEEFDLKENEFLKIKFINNMEKLIKELFAEDVITDDYSDYNVVDGEIVTYKKK